MAYNENRPLPGWELFGFTQAGTGGGIKYITANEYTAKVLRLVAPDEGVIQPILTWYGLCHNWDGAYLSLDGFTRLHTYPETLSVLLGDEKRVHIPKPKPYTVYRVCGNCNKLIAYAIQDPYRDEEVDGLVLNCCAPCYRRPTWDTIPIKKVPIPLAGI